MALSDLSLVTTALMSLIDKSINASPAWGALPPPTVTGLPPDKLSGIGDNVVGFYLYHVTEEPALKSQPWAGRPSSPIRYSPMGLNLHYVLSAQSDLDGTTAPLREQLLMGLAMKALHDYPILDDTTLIGLQPVFPAALMGDDNKLRIQARPVPPGEAVSYWMAGSSPLRLSAYYEVSVVLLDPEEPPTGAGRALLYTISTFVGGLPRLATSCSAITFTVPGETSPRTVLVQPAQAAPDAEITLVGQNLTGDRVALLVRGADWPAAVEVDPAWGGVAASDRFFATVRDTVTGQAVLAGTYSATVKVVRTLASADGTPREIEQLTNATPFLVTPGVTAISAPAPTGIFTVTGETFQHAELPSSAVRAYIGDTQLSLGAAGALGPGEYAILGPTQVEMRLPSGLTPGRFVPVRIVINGAESPPRWVQVP